MFHTCCIQNKNQCPICNEKISKFFFGRWSSRYAPENKQYILYVMIFIITCIYILDIMIHIYSDNLINPKRVDGNNLDI